MVLIFGNLTACIYSNPIKSTLIRLKSSLRGGGGGGGGVEKCRPFEQHLET